MHLNKLKEPFAAQDVEWRIQQAGSSNNGPWAKVLAYVTNRAIMERLDEVCGPHNWRNEYADCPGGGIICGLSIRWGDEWVTKWDGADRTQVEATKGGLSGAMKRAAVQWGIGRYLYNLEEGWAVVSSNGKHYQPKDRNGKYPAFNWDPPKLPSWALPSGGNQESQNEHQSSQPMMPTPQQATPQRAAQAYQDQRMITDAQRKHLQAFYSNRGDSKEDRLASLNKFCDREITSMNDMTMEEASALIEEIKQWSMKNNG